MAALLHLQQQQARQMEQLQQDNRRLQQENLYLHGSKARAKLKRRDAEDNARHWRQMAEYGNAAVPPLPAEEALSFASPLPQQQASAFGGQSGVPLGSAARGAAALGSQPVGLAPYGLMQQQSVPLKPPSVSGIQGLAQQWLGPVPPYGVSYSGDPQQRPFGSRCGVTQPRLSLTQGVWRSR